MNPTIMKLNKIFLLLSLISVLPACMTTNKTTYWVDSSKIDCTMATGQKDCYRVYEGEDLNEAEWQNFENPIEGFEFEPGYFKKIQVKVKSEKKKEDLEHSSALTYTMIKEMEKQRDDKRLINGEWILTQMNEVVLTALIVKPKLNIALEDLILSGKGGCNNYSANITSLSSNKLVLGPIMSTRMACHNNNIESEYLKLLKTTATYQIVSEQLILFNQAGKKILTFKRAKMEVNPRLHDIWFALRIDQVPIKRLVAKPRLEINLTNQQVYGFDGCNEFNGNIEKIDTGKIEIGDMNSTLKACDELNVSDSFNQAFSKIATYQLKNLELTFYDKNGVEVLAFMKGD